MSLPSKQKTFNVAVNGLLSQGKRSADEDGNCKYRHGDLKCAVGMLIPDSIYEERLEGKLPGFAGNMEMNLLLERLGHDPDFCESLQDCHDSSYNFSKMCDNFINLAEKERLTLPRRLQLTWRRR